MEAASPSAASIIFADLVYQADESETASHTSAQGPNGIESEEKGPINSPQGQSNAGQSRDGEARSTGQKY